MVYETCKMEINACQWLATVSTCHLPRRPDSEPDLMMVWRWGGDWWAEGVDGWPCSESEGALR